MSFLGAEASGRRGGVLLQPPGLELLRGVAAKQRGSHHSGGCLISLDQRSRMISRGGCQNYPNSAACRYRGESRIDGTTRLDETCEFG